MMPSSSGSIILKYLLADGIIADYVPSGPMPVPTGEVGDVEVTWEMVRPHMQFEYYVLTPDGRKLVDRWIHAKELE